MKVHHASEVVYLSQVPQQASTPRCPNRRASLWERVFAHHHFPDPVILLAACTPLLAAVVAWAEALQIVE